MLLSSRFSDLLIQFFPEHQRREAVAKLDAAREVVEAALPRFVVGQVRTRLVPTKERWELLSGSKVWPHDADQQVIIDTVKADVGRWWDQGRLADNIGGLHFDAFMSFCDALIRNFPVLAIRFLKAAAETANDRSVIYNAIEMLREGDLPLGDELKITRNYDSDILHEVYHDMVSEELCETKNWHRKLQDEFDFVQVDDIALEEISYTGGECVLINARLSVAATLSGYDLDKSIRKTHDYEIEAHFEDSGLVIDSIEG
jgi:hypothetical protein